MSWKIKKIEIENFKFFQKRFSLDINNRNLLVFGENGAGKSSIYWSIFTHFQAVTKQDGEASKYFVPNNKENLRNRYCERNAPSGIWIDFDGGQGVITNIEDSSERRYIASDTHTEFMRQTMITSDFLNYKLISKLFDFDNSKENEIFDILRKELFPILDLDAVLTDVNKQSKDTSRAEDWWKYLCDFKSVLPRNKKNDNTFNQGSEQYHNFEKLIAQFNINLDLLLTKIFKRTNQIIKEKFAIPAELRYDFKGVKFNEHINAGSRRRTGKLQPPQIILYAMLTSPGVKDNTGIYHPKSFFNEAKISSMGIAFRLAVLEQRTPVDTAASVLLFDDILVSLDMSLRKLVVPIIMSYADKWQLFVFTHDRSLFNLYKDEIDRRKNKLEAENARRSENGDILLPDENWKIVEMFASEGDNGMLEPLVVEDGSLISKAKRYLYECKIPECANALRRCCEKQVKRLLPYNKWFHVTEKLEARCEDDLNSLLEKFQKYMEECRINELVDLFPGLHTDRKLIMNPFSHDDMETPFFRQELKDLIEVLTKLEDVKSFSVVPYSKIRKSKFRMRVYKSHEDGSVTEGWVDFLFCEQFNRLTYKGVNYHNNPKAIIIAASDNSLLNDLKPNSEHCIRKIYSRLHNLVKPGVKQSIPDLIQEHDEVASSMG